MDFDKEFRSCHSNDCYDCPNYEECYLREDQYDDGDSRAMELQENQDFAQDDNWQDYNMGDYYDDYDYD